MALRRVLVAFPATQEDMVALIRELLQEKVFTTSHTGVIVVVHDAVQAKEALAAGDYQLIIVDVQLPESSTCVTEAGAEAGLALLQSLEGTQASIPSLLVAVDPPARLYQAAQELTECRVIPADDQLHRNLLKYTEKFLFRKRYHPEEPPTTPYVVQEAVTPLPARKIANINITINLDRRSGELVEGHYVIRGFGFNYERPGILWLDYETLLKLREKSWELAELESWPDWREKLGEVGADLSSQIYNQIHKENKEFTRNFLEVLARVGGIANTRIRFTLKRETFPVIMEALTDDPLRQTPLTAAEEKFLMLQAPIYRRVDIPIDATYPLFANSISGDEPLNCLIIAAEAAGYVPAVDQGMPALPHLREETDWLVRYLHGLQDAGAEGEGTVKIGDVLRLDKEGVPVGQKFSDSLKDILRQKAPWHLVHFAGHSVYVQKIVHGEAKGRGYFILPGVDGQDNEVMEVAELSVYLRPAGVRFLYLSSCYSAVSEFAVELANNHIPATLGFRWKVADAKAFAHTRRFYQHLFELRSVDQAFLLTRQEMHQEDPQDRTWAAPLLIMQVSD